MYWILKSILSAQCRTALAHPLAVITFVSIMSCLAWIRGPLAFAIFVRLAALALALFLVAVVEEFAHAAAAIQKGKADCLTGLRVSYFTLGSGRRLIVDGFGIQIDGIMTKRDMLHVTAAGPLLSLATGAVFFTVFWMTRGDVIPPLSLATALALLLVVVPLSSLVPVPNIAPLMPFESDGNRMYRLRTSIGLPASGFSREMLRGAGFTLAFVFCRK